MSKSISELIKEYFNKYPNKELKHGPVVDWVTKQWLKNHKEPPRDPWRAIRKLYQEGWLIQVRKGVYKRIPGYKGHNVLTPFSSEIKEQIFKRDNYRCVMCGNGLHNGYEIHADHIIPQSKGGQSTLENGQTLCSEHNLLKKTMQQTETGKKMFVRLYSLAKKEGNKKLLDFCKEILEIYEKHNINCHIKWDK
ncbi:MAG: HNH endonuclease [Candidatus Goldbacteria bacterium]|nr:HNH endonuclease [Candidatus Goldiibacteriota bacterium]